MTSLSTKLTALLGLPLVALVALAGLGVVRAADDAATSRATARGVELSLAAANVARQLSREGDLSAEVVIAAQEATPLEPPAAEEESEDEGAEDEATTTTTAPPVQATPATTVAVPAELNSQRQATDETLDRLRRVVQQGGEATQLHMNQALDGLSRLDQARSAVDRGTGDVVGAYAEIADPVLDLDRILEATAHSRVSNQLTAHLALTRAMQTIAREGSLVGAMLTDGTIDPAAYEKVVSLAASEKHWLMQFEDTASTEDLESFSEAEAVPASATAVRLQQTALANGPGGPAVGSPGVWEKAVGRRLDMLEQVADRTGDKLAAAASAQKAAADGSRRIAVLVFLATLAFAVGAIVVLHRHALAPLRRLARATRTAVDETVPEAVELAQTRGEQAGLSALESLPIASDADLRSMAEAFNALQERAVELASVSASTGDAVRTDVNTVFLNFGRRTQNLVTRQLTHIDNLEARTDNPDTLADLFLLDHLATRLRRNAESLVVLAGADSPRPWARPVSVVNVVRAAVAETADYSRVDLAPMPPASILGSSANDVSHMLAELIDNGLAFSPRETRVSIAGEPYPDGQFMVLISDAGVGMSPRQMTEANDRIATTPEAEVGTARYFGLYVVGRLADRHGIKVRLVRSRSDGVCAEVLLPHTLLIGGEPAPAAAVTTVTATESADPSTGYSPWASWPDG